MRDKIYKLITSNSIDDIRIGLNLAYSQNEWQWFDSLFITCSPFLELRINYVGEAYMCTWDGVDYIIDTGMIWRCISRYRLSEHSALPKIILG